MKLTIHQKKSFHGDFYKGSFIGTKRFKLFDELDFNKQSDDLR